MLKQALFLLVIALAPAAIASPTPTRLAKEPEPSRLPADWRQPLTLAKESIPVLTAQAEPQGAPAMPAAPSSRTTEEEQVAELAKAAQNPIANLISLPFQNNTFFRTGPQQQRTLNALNIQPVVPFPLSKNLLLITRTIVPVINLPTSPTGRESQFGLGDINPQFYFSPITKSRITWGVGPTFVLPTATDELLGQGKWSGGPAAVVVVTTKRWVFGAVGNNVWSFAGASDRKSVNQFLVQPFINYNLSKGWYLSTGPIITANWEAENGDEQWTVPIGGGFGRVFAIGEQKVNATLQAYWNVVKPDGAGDWSLRAQFQFLFPR
ncbi:neuromedin U [Synechococcus sp. RedBA-s]|nr:neuromedin U [Synechococcus sp. RedBA-s]